jgi:hypothetical protein
MKNGCRLGGLGNDELLAALPVLVQRGNENTADVLAHLAELDERRLYLDSGYPSLFARKYFGKGYIQAVIVRARRDGRGAGKSSASGARQPESSPARDQNSAHAGAFGG